MADRRIPPELRPQVPVGARPGAHRVFSLVALLAVALLSVRSVAGSAAAARTSRTLAPSAASTSALSLPAYFEENVGQLPEEVRFVAKARGYVVGMGADGDVVVPAVTWDPSWRAQGTPGSPRRDAIGTPEGVRLRFGACRGSSLQGGVAAPARVRRFSTPEASRPTFDAPTWSSVVRREVSPGVDVAYRVAGGLVAYDFHLAPHADPAGLRLSIEGGGRATVDGRGVVVVPLASGRLLHSSPVAWQDVADVRVPVACRAVADASGAVRYLLGSYDPRRPVIVDPTLEFASYAGSGGDDFAVGVVARDDGRVFFTGQAWDGSFPSPTGSVHASGADAYVACFDVATRTLEWVAFVGGSGYDVGDGIAVGPDGALHVAGWTESSNFPTSLGAVQRTFGGYRDAVVFKLSAAGDALLHATYLGGDRDDYGHGIAVDALGRAHVCSFTRSANFPVVHALQPTYGGGDADGWVACLASDAKSLVFSTYLHSDGAGDGCHAVAVDSDGNTYVACVTEGAGFPTRLPLQGPSAGIGAFLSDTAIVKLSPEGALLFGTYFGGSGRDDPFAVVALPGGDVVVVGETSSSDFPVVRAIQSARRGPSDAYLARLPTDGRATAWATYWGGSAGERAWGAVAPRAGELWVCGHTSSTDLPLVAAVQTSNAGATDAFLARFDGEVPSLGFSTYFGGARDDYGLRLAVVDGNAVVTGYTTSTALPVVDAFQPNYAGGYDGMLFVVSAPANHAPVAHAGDDVVVECDQPTGTLVTLDGSDSTDADGDVLSWCWSVGGGIEFDDPRSASPTARFPIGAHLVTLVVTDGRGGVAVDDVLVVVEDTSPPQVSVTTDVAALWPPNHKMNTVVVSVVATDACAEPAALTLDAVTLRSSEPDDAAGSGDGQTSGDCDGADGYAGPVDVTAAFRFVPTRGRYEGEVRLRAERAGSGPGRSYVLEARVADPQGNTTVSTCVVVVPKSR